MKRISLVDCPGIVYDMGDSEVDTVLKGVVRAERLPDPTDFIPAILERSKPEHLTRTYGVVGWKNAEDLMTQIAKRNGRLLKNGEPDFHAVAVNMINDWQRGKLPFFVPPPTDEMMGMSSNETSTAAFESAMLQAKELKGAEVSMEGGREESNAEDEEDEEEEAVEEEEEEEAYEDDPAPEAYEVPQYASRPLSKRHQRLKAKFHKLEASGLDWDDL
jgi:nuclear GTP-binding protein